MWPPSLKSQVVARKTIHSRAYSVVCMIHMVVLCEKEPHADGVADGGAYEHEYDPCQGCHQL